MQNTPECAGIPRRQNPPRSEVYLTGASGAGSTNIAVRYFTTTSKSIGNDLVVSNSAVYGTSVTVGTAGVYSIFLFDGYGSGTSQPCVTVNNLALSTTPAVTDPTVVLVFLTTGGYSSSSSVTLNLNQGDTIRAMWITGTNAPNDTSARFRITRNA